MEQVYYMLKGMISDLPKETQEKINTAIAKAKNPLVKTVADLSDEDVHKEMVFVMCMFEAAKELNIDIS